MNAEAALTGALMRANIEARAAAGANSGQMRPAAVSRPPPGRFRTPREQLYDRARTVCGPNGSLWETVADTLSHSSFDSLNTSVQSLIVSRLLPAVHDDRSFLPRLNRLLRAERFGSLGIGVQTRLLQALTDLGGLRSAEAVVRLARHPVFGRINPALQVELVRVIRGPEVGEHNSKPDRAA